MGMRSLSRMRSLSSSTTAPSGALASCSVRRRNRLLAHGHQKLSISPSAGRDAAELAKLFAIVGEIGREILSIALSPLDQRADHRSDESRIDGYAFAPASRTGAWPSAAIRPASSVVAASAGP